MKLVIYFLCGVLVFGFLNGKIEAQNVNEQLEGYHHLQSVVWVGQNGKKQFQSYYGVLRNPNEYSIEVVPELYLEDRNGVYDVYYGVLYEDSRMIKSIDHIEPKKEAFFWVESDTFWTWDFIRFRAYMKFDVDLY